MPVGVLLRTQGKNQLLVAATDLNVSLTAELKSTNTGELSPPSSRVRAVWRLAYRRLWVRFGGIGSFVPDHAIAREMPVRDRLRLEACWIAATSTDLAPEYLTRYQVLALKGANLRSRCMALLVETSITVISGARRHARVMAALASAAARKATRMFRRRSNMRAP